MCKALLVCTHAAAKAHWFYRYLPITRRKVNSYMTTLNLNRTHAYRQMRSLSFSRWQQLRITLWSQCVRAQITLRWRLQSDGVLSSCSFTPFTYLEGCCYGYLQFNWPWAVTYITKSWKSKHTSGNVRRLYLWRYLIFTLTMWKAELLSCLLQFDQNKLMLIYYAEKISTALDIYHLFKWVKRKPLTPDEVQMCRSLLHARVKCWIMFQLNVWLALKNPKRRK